MDGKVYGLFVERAKEQGSCKARKQRCLRVFCIIKNTFQKDRIDHMDVEAAG